MSAQAESGVETSGVMPDAIKEKLVEQLGATHVHIEDLSGILFMTLLRICSFTNVHCRRLWTNVRSCHSLSSIREENDPRPAPSRQRRPQARDCCHTCVDTEVLYTRGVGEEAGNYFYMNKRVLMRSGIG